MNNIFKLAFINIIIEGDGEVPDLIREELKSIKEPQGNKINQIDLRIKFTDKLKDLVKFTKVDNILVNDKLIQVEELWGTYQFSDGEVLIALGQNFKKSKLSKKWKKFKDWNYLSKEENIAKDIMYNLFDYVTALHLLGKRCSYLHASSFTKNDRCAAMIAWGGVGKTTTMLKLVLDNKWKYLSDDLGLIDKEGIMHRTPKKLQVYGYNTLGQEKLQDALMNGRSRMDKLSWKVRLSKKGPKKVRRRISAEELLGYMNVSQSSKLTDVFFLQRTNTVNINVSDISIDQLVKRCSIILLNELQPLTDLMIAIESTNQENILPTLTEFQIKTQNVLYESMQGLTPKLVEIPEKAGPNQLAQFFNRELS